MIGRRLRDLREDSDLTQEQLGRILNINKHSISSYERDKSEPPDIIKVKISKYFNVSSDYLLGIVNDPTPISQDKSIIRLPIKFPAIAEKELKDYINYLMSKYNQ